MIVFRKAGLEDTPLIEELAQEIFPATYKEMLSEGQIEFMMDWMYSQENLRRQILEDGHIYHIVYYDGMPVGYVSLQQQGERLWHLQKIYLKPGMQGKAVGKKKLLTLATVCNAKYIDFPAIMPYVDFVNIMAYDMTMNIAKHHSPLFVSENTSELSAANSIEAHLGMHKASSGDFHIGNGYYMTDFIMAMEVH